jgi:hypothetical protein
VIVQTTDDRFAAAAKSEAVLPAYLLGMALATFFITKRALAQRSG